MIKPMAMLAGAMLLAAASADEGSVANRILVPPVAPGPHTKPFVSAGDPVVALTHVRLIDGTGAVPAEDRTIILDGGKIASIGPASMPVPAGARVIDLTGRSVLPGIVGMHDHQYYIARPGLDAAGVSTGPVLVPQMTFSSPRLYLAGGVTTLRTTGSVETYTDLNLKRSIDRGRMPGPHMDVTGPYLEGPNSFFIQMHELHDTEDARGTVAFWAEQGVTSFKAYMNITRTELKAAADEAHKRGLKITGHLCSVTYPEAVAAGIDDFEHGFWVNTQLDPDKKPDACPTSEAEPTLLAMDGTSPESKALIRLLVEHHVAVTSTLPVLEPYSATNRPLPPKQLAVLSPGALTDYLYVRDLQARTPAARLAKEHLMYAHELAMERAFVKAGGLLLAGPDPTGGGNVIPGFGDQRAIELLVGAGFTPLEAIRIGTLNGATYLGLADRIGSIAPGKNADLLVVKGDPSKTITDIENVETVFKDGVGYDPAALLESVRGAYGRY